MGKKIKITVAVIFVLIVLYFINAIGYKNKIFYIALNIKSYNFNLMSNIYFWFVIGFIALIGYFYYLYRGDR